MFLLHVHHWLTKSPSCSCQLHFQLRVQPLRETQSQRLRDMAKPCNVPLKLLLRNDMSLLLIFHWPKQVIHSRMMSTGWCIRIFVRTGMQLVNCFFYISVKGTSFQPRFQVETPTSSFTLPLSLHLSNLPPHVLLTLPPSTLV